MHNDMKSILVPIKNDRIISFVFKLEKLSKYVIKNKNLSKNKEKSDKIKTNKVFFILSIFYLIIFFE